MESQELEELMLLQSGVVSRRQAIAHDLTDADIERKVRRREWARVLPGVFVDHTGELTWLQQAWAAVLFSWPAALTHSSALRAAEGPGRGKESDERIHVVVERSRSLVAPPRVRIHRGVDLAAQGAVEQEPSARAVRGGCPRRGRCSSGRARRDRRAGSRSQVASYDGGADGRVVEGAQAAQAP